MCSVEFILKKINKRKVVKNILHDIEMCGQQRLMSANVLNIKIVICECSDKLVECIYTVL